MSEAHDARRERLASSLLQGYKRFVSPVMHSVSLSQCKYLPTCSEYGYVAVMRYGWLRGGWMALRRVSRCHPFAKGGLDPVP